MYGEALVAQELIVIIEHQLPLLQQLHRSGSLAPVAATMDAAGEVTGEAFTNDEAANVPVENTVDRFARQFARAFADGAPLKAAAIFFHGHAADSIVRAAHTAEEANVLVAWLQHESGQSVQAVIPYGVERGAAGETDGWTYGEAIFSEVAAYPLE